MAACSYAVFLCQDIAIIILYTEMVVFLDQATYIRDNVCQTYRCQWLTTATENNIAFAAHTFYKSGAIDISKGSTSETVLT